MARMCYARTARTLALPAYLRSVEVRRRTEPIHHYYARSVSSFLAANVTRIVYQHTAVAIGTT